MIDLNSLSLPALFTELARDGSARRLFEIARDEDLGVTGLAGDITTRAVIPESARASARVVSRAPGVLSGLAAAPMLFDVFGVRLEWKPQVADAARISANQPIAALTGPARHLLAIERPLLNTLSRCSGVATLASRFVEAVAGTRAQVCDTRKTIPGWRALDKYASRCGGAHLHRIALYDAALFKDNHLAGIAPGELGAKIAAAATAARAAAVGGLRFVEVEVDSLEQLDALLRLPAGTIDIALLDNMPPARLSEAVAMRNARRPTLLLEASGGVTLETTRAIAQTGVDRISVGEITHSAPALDLGLDFD